MSTWNFLFKYLSTISFRIKLASLLSTFLKFFISLLVLTAEVFPFWSFPACGDTWARNNPKDDNFIQIRSYFIRREPKVWLKFTLESVNFEAGRTAVRARFVAAPLVAGWLFGTAFACGKTWLEVCRGRLLFLDSNVDSEKQTPGIKQNNRWWENLWKHQTEDWPKRASLSFAMVRLVTILSWSLLARSYWSPVNKPCWHM